MSGDACAHEASFSTYRARLGRLAHTAACNTTCCCSRHAAPSEVDFFRHGAGVVLHRACDSRGTPCTATSQGSGPTSTGCKSKQAGGFREKIHGDCRQAPSRDSRGELRRRGKAGDRSTPVAACPQTQPQLPHPRPLLHPEAAHPQQGATRLWNQCTPSLVWLPLAAGTQLRYPLLVLLELGPQVQQLCRGTRAAHELEGWRNCRNDWRPSRGSAGARLMAEAQCCDTPSTAAAQPHGGSPTALHPAAPLPSIPHRCAAARAAGSGKSLSGWGPSAWPPPAALPPLRRRRLRPPRRWRWHSSCGPAQQARDGQGDLEGT